MTLMDLDANITKHSKQKEKEESEVVFQKANPVQKSDIFTEKVEEELQTDSQTALRHAEPLPNTAMYHVPNTVYQNQQSIPTTNEKKKPKQRKKHKGKTKVTNQTLDDLNSPPIPIKSELNLTKQNDHITKANSQVAADTKQQLQTMQLETIDNQKQQIVYYYSPNSKNSSKKEQETKKKDISDSTINSTSTYKKQESIEKPIKTEIDKKLEQVFGTDDIARNKGKDHKEHHSTNHKNKEHIHRKRYDGYYNDILPVDIHEDHKHRYNKKIILYISVFALIVIAAIVSGYLVVNYL